MAPPEHSVLEEVALERRTVQREPESSDTEADISAEPAGSWPKGVGDPMMAGRGERARYLTDGAGLRSLGRWGPRKRTPAVFARKRRWRLE